MRAIGEASDDLFAALGREVGAEEHVDDGEERGVVLVVIFGRAAVMQPVPLRAGDEPAEWTEIELDVGVIEEAVGREENQSGVRHQQIEAAENGQRDLNGEEAEHEMPHRVAHRCGGVHALVVVVQSVCEPEAGDGVLSAVKPILQHVVADEVEQCRECDFDQRDGAPIADEHAAQSALDKNAWRPAHGDVEKCAQDRDDAEDQEVIEAI